MVTCKNCSSTNSLDSAFCKKCGAVLPEDEVTAAKEKLELIVADGMKIFSIGRTDEAAQIADQAVATNPHSVAALSLKAMCHERRGEISEAIDCHERVLAIDPDSMIDKIKVNDLRNLLVTRSSIAAVPDRRFAIAGAVAAFVLVASIGVLAARTANREETPERVAMNTPASTGQVDPNIQRGLGNQVNNQVEQNSNSQVNQPNEAVQQPQNTQQPVYNSPRQTPRTGTPRDIELPTLGGGGTLPRPNDEGSQPFVISAKDLPTGPIGKSSNPPKRDTQTASKPPTSEDPDPTSPQTQQPQPQTPREAPGIMEIKIVGRGPAANSGGQAPTSGGNGVEALMRTARSQYQLGNYSAAALGYERALRAGGDPAYCNQRLGQAYEKLGRNSEAVSAYNRAIDVLQGQLNSGSGDKGRISAALDSCRQAVQVLGG